MSRARVLDAIDDMQAGTSSDAAAAKHGLTPSYVRRVALAHGMHVPRRPWTKGNSLYQVLAALLNTTDSYAEIGQRHDITGERVRQIANAAIEAGIRLAERSGGSRRLSESRLDELQLPPGAPD